MRKLIVLAMLAGFVVVCSDRGVSDDAGECQAIVEKAVRMCKERGAQATLRAIDDPTGPFVRGELYVFAVAVSTNAVEAHPHDKSIKRLPMDNITDANGQKFFQRFNEVAKEQGAGWVEYTWIKPGGTDAKRKRSFIMRVPDEDLYIGSGYYLK
jgi:cytochrome c